MDAVFEIDDVEPKTEVVEESKVANTKIRKPHYVSNYHVEEQRVKPTGSQNKVKRVRLKKSRE